MFFEVKINVFFSLYFLIFWYPLHIFSNSNSKYNSYLICNKIWVKKVQSSSPVHQATSPHMSSRNFFREVIKLLELSEALLTRTSMLSSTNSQVQKNIFNSEKLTCLISAHGTEPSKVYKMWSMLHLQFLQEFPKTRMNLSDQQLKEPKTSLMHA